MRRPMFPAEAALGTARDVVDLQVAPPTGTTARAGEVVEWLARLRLLHGVPFNHLVPLDEMLPPESIRFFYLDRNVTDALVDGAVSVAGVSSHDRASLEANQAALRDAVDAAERRVRPVEDAATLVGLLGGPIGIEEGSAERLSGFLLRSRAVSGWPGMEVTGTVGTDDARRLRLLRMERLAPAVLFVLFDGIPDEVAITEPKSGLQFGVDLGDEDDEATLPLRFPTNGVSLPPATQADEDDLPDEALPGSLRFTSNVPASQRDGDDLRVPFRPDGHGTVHVGELVRRLRQTSWSGPGGSWRMLTSTSSDPGEASDELAVQLLQFPYRQRFSGSGSDGGRLRPGLLAWAEHADRTWLVQP